MATADVGGVSRDPRISAPSVWRPGPILLQGDQTVTIGLIDLPFGPRKVEEQGRYLYVEQQGKNAVYGYYYGNLPRQYLVEGWINQGDPAQVRALINQFKPGNKVLPLLVPAMGIADMVRMADYRLPTDAQTQSVEMYYMLTLRTSSGQVTQLT